MLMFTVEICSTKLYTGSYFLEKIRRNHSIRGNLLSGERHASFANDEEQGIRVALCYKNHESIFPATLFRDIFGACATLNYKANNYSADGLNRHPF
jgi:hypothetical protein